MRAAKRKELGIGDGDILMLSVGELNRNKNHEVVLHAMASLGDKRLKYVIAGRGVLKEHLEQLATELGINEQLQLLGFRTDVRELFKAADVFAHPSYREGLSVAVMEAMASGLPVLCSRIRGNTDLIDEGEGGFLFSPAKSDEVTIALSKIMVAKDLKARGAYNIEKAKSLDVGAVMEIMRELYNPVNVL